MPFISSMQRFWTAYCACAATLAGVVACAGATPIAPYQGAQAEPAATHRAPAPIASVSDAPEPQASASAAAPAASSGAVASAAPAPSSAGSFPPASFAPPHARSAREGDGIWTESAAAGEPGKGAVVQTTVHPHPVNRFVPVQLVAMDLHKLDLHLSAGTRDPPSDKIPAERRTGLVPAADQARLIAVFNGGFQAKHGGHGMMVQGEVFLPARDNLCTVALLRDGGVRIGTWSALQSEQARYLSWRQSPPCLLENGEMNPLARGGDGARKYGMAIDGKMTIRRTALGLDASGRTLFFGYGEDVTPALLAEAMKTAGAVDAAQLDINWSYTRFFFYEHPSAGPPVINNSLVPKLKYDREAYVTKPSGRDFFFVARKP